ncbi:MAG: energy-coupling factor transporter transmembrane component T [Bacillota bacterium]|nr:energy-coupling factor transporter transmembrane component T [Bacillota bacterium]
MRRLQLMQRLDPRTKLLLVVLISTMAILFTDILWLAALFCSTLLFLFLGGMGPSFLAAKMKRFLFLFLALLVIQSIFSPAGEPLLAVGSLNIITTGGIVKGLSVILRMLVIISSAMILLTSDSMDLVLGFVHLRIPYEIAFMVLLAMRFLPVLEEEIRDALVAVQLRGVNIKEIPLGQKIKIYTYIFMPVVVSSLLKAKQTAIAMEARAFRAYERRTYLKELTLQKADYALMVVVLLAGIALFTIYFTGR